MARKILFNKILYDLGTAILVSVFYGYLIIP
mgnify:CR=1 FL=1